MKAEFHDTRRPTSPDWLMLELRRSFRRLVRLPRFTIPTFVTLALSIGAATVIFTLLEGIVLRPLPYPDSDRLYRLQSSVPLLNPEEAWGLSKHQFLYLKRASTSFSNLALYTTSYARLWGEEPGAPPTEQVVVAQVSSDLLPVLGIRPLLGRVLQPEDNATGGRPAVWLTDTLWRSRFGASPEVVGHTLLLDDERVEVAGVLPPEARLPEELMLSDIRVGLWKGLQLDPAHPASASHVFRSVGRLRPGLDSEVAALELDRLTARLPEELPQTYSRRFLEDTGFTTRLRSLRSDVVGEMAAVLWLLLGAVALLLAAATANVASLFLAEAESRSHETAVQACLGAGRHRLIVQSVAGAILIPLAASFAGLTLAPSGIRALVAAAPPFIPRLSEVRLTGAGAAFALIVALIVGAFLSVLSMRRLALGSSIPSTGSRWVAGTPRQRAFRTTLVVTQLALSFVLLSGAALLYRSFVNLTRVDPGVDPAGVLTFRIVVPEEGYEGFEALGEFYRELAARLEGLPTVQHAGLASGLPLTRYIGGCSSILPDNSTEDDGQPPCLPVFLVSPGYFESLGITIRGASPGWPEFVSRAPFAVVSARAAARLWPGAQPVGHSLRLGADSAPYQVVGVANDVPAFGLSKPPVEAVYLPLVPAAGAEHWPPVRSLAVAIRTDPTKSGGDAPDVRRLLAGLDPRIATAEFVTMKEIVAESLKSTTLLTVLLVVSSVISAVLSASGVYGLLSYLVVQRRREIGIRVAVGARPHQVVQLVVFRTLRLALIGAGFGLAGALLSTRLLGSLLFGVSPTDPAALGAAGGFLILVAIAGSCVPARRAAGLSPLSLLREEL